MSDHGFDVAERLAEAVRARVSDAECRREHHGRFGLYSASRLGGPKWWFIVLDVPLPRVSTDGEERAGSRLEIQTLHGIKTVRDAAHDCADVLLRES